MAEHARDIIWSALAFTMALAIVPAAAADQLQVDVGSLGSQITGLEEDAERADAQALLDHARRALRELDHRRARGEMEAASRAEAIARSALRAAELRIEAHRARTELAMARARLIEVERRRQTAAAALVRARRERERAEHAEEPAPVPPATASEGAPSDDGAAEEGP